MRQSVLVLALLVSAVQTVGWVECCCILICKHHNDPCNNCKDKPKTEVQPDCCKNKTAAPAHDSRAHGRCSRVEPSSEISVQSADLPPLTVDVIAELPVASPLPAPPDREERLIEVDRARGSPPLLLLCSLLLI